MMESVSGPFPGWMINTAKTHYISLFDDDNLICVEAVKSMIKSKAPSYELREANIEALRNVMKYYDKLDAKLGDLIRKCLILDPHERISCEEARRHPLFNS